MRRRHNVVLVTLIIVGIVFLFAQSQDELPEGYSIRGDYGKARDDSSSGSVPAQVRVGLQGGQSIHLPEPKVDSPKAPSADEHASPATSTLHTSLPLSTPIASDHVAALPPSNDVHPPTPLPSDLPVFEAEFPFQRDLEIDLPIDILKALSDRHPHNYDPNGPRTYAYATFMATRNPSLKDPYFLAIHSLIYRILWSTRSRTGKYPFVVFVADFVTPEQRALLAGAGAIVRELAPLEWNPDVPGVQKRWKDLFAKLNMWNETEFERILFLDADAFPLANIDEMFDIAPMSECDASKIQLDDFLADRTPVCEPYIFAGVPHDPTISTNWNINVGSMVFTPSSRMHQRLLQNYVKTDKYDCLMAEQAFLGWQFSPVAAYPATKLDRTWGGFFPQQDEEGKLKVVHEKIWAFEEGWMRKEWDVTWEETMRFYGSEEFRESRTKDGTGLF